MPVGVDNSPSIDPWLDFTLIFFFLNNSITAGDGIDSLPWSAWIKPFPKVGSLQKTFFGFKYSIEVQTPIISTKESIEPISWKWTSSGLIPWTLPSAVAKDSKTS